MVRSPTDAERAGRTEKLSITLPAELASELRQAAGPGGVSSFLAEAARQHLRRQKLMHALNHGFGAWGGPAVLERAGTLTYLQRLREIGRDRAERLRRLVRGEDA